MQYIYMNSLFQSPREEGDIVGNSINLFLQIALIKAGWPMWAFLPLPTLTPAFQLSNYTWPRSVPRPLVVQTKRV